MPLTTPATLRSFATPVRPDARFVAQLIATAAHAPQTRTFCRAAPGDAILSYSEPRDAVAGVRGVMFSQVA